MDGIQQALDTTCTRTRDMDRKNPLLLERGRGATFTDAEGRSYVDFTSCTGAAPSAWGTPGSWKPSPGTSPTAAASSPGP
ncbi:hypothetical protein HFP72_31875 [Nocardiopsis sp. ARC36]